MATIKKTISNAGLFLIAARLARYTGNTTYLDWRTHMELGRGRRAHGTEHYYFYDGASTSTNCIRVTRYQWSYNAACFVAGSAYLYNLTALDLWRDRRQNILDAAALCSRLRANVYRGPTQTRSRSKHTSRDFYGLTAILASWTYDRIYQPLVNTVVNGVSQSCTGGHDGVTCGTTWLATGWDNTAGLGQQMTALETVQNLLISQVPPPIPQKLSRHRFQTTLRFRDLHVVLLVLLLDILPDVDHTNGFLVVDM
ncbi:glycoside hydrolase [Lipomyces orientalis]|uniref:Glycoside hydrolase n=1 Tax=Lipomyces orientalis TaxID=1233043 RepID=A0ACC3TM53_9ASCO